jgi:hypothetical protein
MLSKQMTDNQTTADDSASSDKQEPEYSFEGFNIDFSEKVMLTTPAGPKAPEKGSAGR